MNNETIDRMHTIADTLRTICRSRLDELISLANTCRRNIDEKTAEILVEISKVKI